MCVYEWQCCMKQEFTKILPFKDKIAFEIEEIICLLKYFAGAEVN